MKRVIQDYLLDIQNECDYLLRKTTKLNQESFLNNEDLKD